ncbi:TetR/AcrR family transcriptional regulator [soil metagenome]
MATDESTEFAIDRTRSAIQSSNDPRVARTRDAILAAVRRLLTERTDDEPIAVIDIVRASGVSRSSFYSHFTGLDDVAAYMLREAFARIRSLYSQSLADDAADAFETMRLSQIRLVDHFVENRVLFSALAAQPLGAVIQSDTVTAMAAEIGASFSGRDVPAGLRPDIAATYIAHAAVGLLYAWLRGEIEASAEELVASLMSLMPAWLSGA